MLTACSLASLALASVVPHTLAQFTGTSDTASAAPVNMVDCGGHFESSCSMCPNGNGVSWCNGDCHWLTIPGADSGQCVSNFGRGPISNIYIYLTSFAVNGFLMFIFACVYKQKVVMGPPPLPKVNSVGAPARRGLFECFWHPDTCLYTTFCLPVVAGKNYYAANICGFWPGCIFTFLGTYSPFYFFTVLARAMLSGRVQANMGQTPNVLTNCIYSVFCFPCDVGRESLEVDAEIGAEITCCCQVKISPRVISEMKNFVASEKRICTKYRICGGGGH